MTSLYQQRVCVYLGDLEWLSSVGFPIASGIAEFWVSRVVPSASNSSAYSILNVMPPDEWHYPVNDSVYTNVVAAIAINFAVEAAAILGQQVPANWSDIAARIQVESPLPYHSLMCTSHHFSKHYT